MANVAINAGSGAFDRTTQEKKGKVTVSFVEYKYRKSGQSSLEYLDEIREAVKGIAGAEIEVAREIMGPPTGKALNIEIAGEDIDQLVILSGRLQQFINALQIPGIEQLQQDMEVNKPEIAVNIDRLLEVDATLLENKQKLQDIATEKNRVGKQIPKLDQDQKKEALATLSQLKQDEADYNEAIKQLQPEFDALMGQVAQPADPDVPVGEDDTENVELRKWGTIREFDFEPKDHVELGLDLGIIDIERGVKLAGTRNYFLKGDGALLHWAVLRFSMDTMIGKGYTPMSVPLLM